MAPASTPEIHSERAFTPIQGIEVDIEPISARAPMIVPSVPPGPAEAFVEPAPISAMPQSSFLGMHLGSRWRFIATVTMLTLVGLVIRERTEVARFFKMLPFVKRPIAAAKKVEKEIAITAPPAQLAPCPDDMAFVEKPAEDYPGAQPVRVCVDKFEASLVEILPTGGEKPWSPYLPVDGHVVKAVSKPDVVPQGYINRDEAQQACESAGKRLCQAEEWRAACEGPSHSKYPYGDSLDEEACNTKGKAPLGELFSSSFRDYLWDSKIMNDPSLNALDGTVAKTGAFARCTNGYGVHDMVGNLHEWTAEKRGVFRGGYYLESQKNGEGCKYATTAHVSQYHDYSTGFRCCKDAE